MLDTSILLGVAYAYVDFFLAVVGAVVTHEDTVGHQLNSRANFGHARTHYCSAGAIHFDLPFDARHRCSVVDIDESGHLILHEAANTRSLSKQWLELIARELYLYLFANRGTLFDRHDLGARAGQISDRLAIAILNLKAVQFTITPICHFNKDIANEIGRCLLVAAELLAGARLHDDTLEVADLIDSFLHAEHDVA